MFARSSRLSKAGVTSHLKNTMPDMRYKTYPSATLLFAASRVWECEEAHAPSIGAGSETVPTEPVHLHQVDDTHQAIV